MEAAKTRFQVRDLTYIGIFAALMAICAWISIPVPPPLIPFTLQTLGVFLAVGLLGGKRGTIAVLVYILLGAAGAPVFAGFHGGMGSILGLAGGYIVGFLFTALVMWAMERLPGNRTLVLGASMVLGLAVCYAFGTAWYMVLYAQRGESAALGAVLAVCVAPFLVPDAIKIALALLLTNRLKPHIK